MCVCTSCAYVLNNFYSHMAHLLLNYTYPSISLVEGATVRLGLHQCVFVEVHWL